jgi:hypothetical protein
MHENEHAAAIRLDNLYNTTADRRAGLHGDGWNAPRPTDIPIWHMRPGMQVQAPTHAEGWDTVVSAPQHDPNWRNEHIRVRNDLSGVERTLSRPYRSFVFVKAPAWMLSSEYFEFTHDNTPHPRTSALKPAAPSRSRAAAFKGQGR